MHRHSSLYWSILVYYYGLALTKVPGTSTIHASSPLATNCPRSPTGPHIYPDGEGRGRGVSPPLSLTPHGDISGPDGPRGLQYFPSLPGDLRIVCSASQLGALGALS